MSDGPYVDNRLAATKAGIPKALVETEYCVAQLQDALALDGESTVAAYDLLANWARVRRIRLELLEQLGGTEELARADDMVRERGAELARLALSVPNPQAWLEETRFALDNAYAIPLATDVRSQLATRLLTDLDDAELVLYAARRSGIEDAELDEELLECNAWVAHNADLFLAASVHVQAVGMTLRPDLEQYDYGLAVTAIKFQELLEAAAGAEEQLGLAHVQPLPARVVSRLLRDCVREKSRHAFTIARLALRQRAEERVLAAAAPESTASSPDFWEWKSPQDDRRARLILPTGPEASAADPVILAFYDATRERATAMAGETVVLCGIQATVTDRGTVDFPQREFLSSDQPLQLKVGTNLTEWELLTDSTHQLAEPSA